jgi:hypothetical protein
MVDLARLLGLDPPSAADVARLSKGVSGRKRTDDACGGIAAALGVDEDRARTVLYTVQGIMRRADELEDARPDDVFWYFGPVDGQMRPFCREHVGKVYRRATIAQLDNGQLPDPLLTGGGWECRHQFDVLSRFSELVEIADTGRRVPEVARALADLGTAPAVESDLPPWSRRPKCPGPIAGRGER